MTLRPQGWSDSKNFAEETSLAIKKHHRLRIYLVASYHMERKEKREHSCTLED